MKAEAFCRWVDTINEKVGRAASMLLIPLVIIVMLEVILRYFFDRPTIWAWDVNVQLAGALILLAGGYTLLYKRHVIIDVVVGHFSPRARAITDLVTSPVFFIGYGVLLWLAIDEARYSVQIRELYSSVWSPPMYYFKVVMAVGFFLLLIQGVVKFIRDLSIATSSEARGKS